MLHQLTEWIQANAGQIFARTVGAVLVFGLVVAATWLLARVVERGLKRRSVRAATLASIVRSLITLTGLGVAVVMGLSQLGINVATVVAGAGVVGLAVGFGAQTLVKDCISGFFLILDDVVQVGDVAEVDDKIGVVERVGLRVTQVRAYSGQLWYLPNGAIEKVGNFHREWNRAEVVVGIAYEADVRRALEVLDRVGREWANECEDVALEPPEAQGVLELADSSVNLRLIAKVRAGRVWEVERELRRRVKLALDAADVEIAYPKRVLYVRAEGTTESTREDSHVCPAEVAS